jgi:hypothetical protein
VSKIYDDEERKNKMSDPASSLTPDQIEFTNAFNNQRMTLAGFQHCSNREELHVVRDAFYLGLAKDLQLPEYAPIQMAIVIDPKVAETTGTADGITQMVQTARGLEKGWYALVQAVKAKAEAVDSDIDGIWNTLETSRLKWLTAASSAHSVKLLLQQGLEKDNAMDSAGAVSDAMMIWIYCLCLNLSPPMQEAAAAWARVVQLPDKTKPLVGYKAELWDPRKEEWRLLDLGAQQAAEQAGASLQDAWQAK